jgi:hypothetical protein
VGVYRFWRDIGYPVGALLAGASADMIGMAAAMWLVSAVTCLSGVVVVFRMDEPLLR